MIYFCIYLAPILSRMPLLALSLIIRPRPWLVFDERAQPTHYF